MKDYRKGRVKWKEQRRVVAQREETEKVGSEWMNKEVVNNELNKEMHMNLMIAMSTNRSTGAI